MSDIHCRYCGEPWDSTGGLHHTHSDLHWSEYWQLVAGLGCPSCEGSWLRSPAHEDAWLRSLRALGEGEIWDAADAPQPPWLGHFTGDGVWAGKITDRQVITHLLGGDHQLSEVQDLCQLEVFEDDDLTCVYALLPEEHFDRNTAVGRANSEHLANHMTVAEFGGFYAQVGFLDHAPDSLWGMPRLQAVKSCSWLVEQLASLEDDPILDEQLYDAHAQCETERELRSLIQQLQREAAGMLDDQLVEVLCEHYAAGGGRLGVLPKQLLEGHILGLLGPPLGWSVLQTIEKDCLFVRSPVGRGEKLYGFYLRGERETEWGVVAEHELQLLSRFPHAPFDGPNWERLPPTVRGVIYETIAEGDENVS